MLEITKRARQCFTADERLDKTAEKNTATQAHTDCNCTTGQCECFNVEASSFRPLKAWATISLSRRTYIKFIDSELSVTMICLVTWSWWRGWHEHLQVPCRLGCSATYTDTKRAPSQSPAPIAAIAQLRKGFKAVLPPTKRGASLRTSLLSHRSLASKAVCKLLKAP